MLKLKSTGTIRMFICVLSVVASNICCAKITVENIALTIKCKPSLEVARTKPAQIPGVPNVRLSLTSLGIRVAGEEELVTIWDNFTTGVTHGDEGQSPNIIARCIPSEEPMNMYPIDGFVPGSGPTLQCDWGQGMRIVMFGPFDPVPTRYIYEATLKRETRTDDPEEVSVSLDTSIASGLSSGVLPHFSVPQPSMLNTVLSSGLGIIGSK